MKSLNLIRWGGPAMMLGGLLWVLTYVVEIVIGVTLGEATYNRADPSASLLEWLWPACFMGAIFFLGIGLLGVRAQLEGRAKILGILGTLLACVAIVAASINLVLLAGVFGKATALDGLGFLGVIGTLGGSVLLARIIHERLRRPAKERAMNIGPGVPTPDAGAPSSSTL